MNTVEKTIELIQTLHAGQKDWNGVDYWHHPVAVMNLLNSRVMTVLDQSHQLDIRLAALLHDVLEDTSATREDLLALGYSSRCVTIVELVTRNQNDNITYMEKIQKIVDSGDVGAMLVKLADNTHNSDHTRGINWDNETRRKAERLKQRYSNSMQLLKIGLQSFGYDV